MWAGLKFQKARFGLCGLIWTQEVLSYNFTNLNKMIETKHFCLRDENDICE